MMVPSRWAAGGSARVGLGLAVVVLWAAAARPVQAQVTAFTFPDPAAGTASGAGNDGFRFQPSAPIFVTAMGYYDRNQDGLALNHPVGIFDGGTQALLTSTTVGPGSMLSGLFRYNAITPLLLNAGQPYVVVGFHPGSATQDLAADTPPGLTIAPGISLQGYFFNVNASLSFPATNGDPARFFGPNFQFTPVPEPGSVALVGLAAVGGLGFGWRRRARIFVARGTHRRSHAV